MATTYATDQDVIKVWGALSADEAEIVPGLIEQASVKLQLKVPNIDSMIAADPLLASAATIAVVNAVKRVLQNPEAVRQISTTTGPVTDSKTIDTAVSSGFVYISAEDLRDLLRRGRKPRIRAFRVRSGYL